MSSKYRSTIRYTREDQTCLHFARLLSEKEGHNSEIRADSCRDKLSFSPDGSASARKNYSVSVDRGEQFCFKEQRNSRAEENFEAEEGDGGEGA